MIIVVTLQQKSLNSYQLSNQQESKVKKNLEKQEKKPAVQKTQ